MFTGIVEELGAVADLTDQGDAVRLSVRGTAVTEGTALGDSIAVNGCCLTVAELQEDGFTADVMTQTLRLTSLGTLRPGSRVNLERAVTPTTRLGGHVVQGHVDATGEVVARTPSEHWELVEVSLPAELARYVVRRARSPSTASASPWRRSTTPRAPSPSRSSPRPWRGPRSAPPRSARSSTSRST